MFEKIECIKEIGLFKNYVAKGDVALKKVNLIYGENGTGKTTLSNILRSLTTGNPKYINVKKEENAGRIELKKNGDTKKIIFDKNKWSETVPNIEIFDSAFIEENIHSGYAVTNNHKKKLVNLILGEDAVAKNHEFNNYKKQQDIFEQELKMKFAEIKGDRNYMFSQKEPYDFFISKREIPVNISENIEAQKIKIKNIEMKDTILKYPVLAEINKPGGDVTKVKDVLMKTIDDISSDAEKLVKEHILQFGGLEETWIEKGFSLISEDKEACPFCGSPIKELPLIKTYSMYFNKEYLTLKDKVASYNKLSSFIKDNYTKRIEIIDANKKIWESLWKNHIKEDVQDSHFKDLDILIANLDQLITTKQKNLLDAVNESDINDFISLYDALILFYEEYENNIKSLNEKIQLFKNNLGDINLIKEKETLFTLQVSAYQKELADKDDEVWKKCIALCNTIVTLKQKTIPTCKAELDDMIKKNCTRHQENINAYLKKMNAKFSLEMDKKLSYITKEANYNYYIKIGEKRIQIKGDENDNFGCPCLGNCLSEGDKTSLAFAFFLSKLKDCSELGNKIIVFDDPISSLDAHRRNQTISLVNQFVNNACFSFVFSHDAYFLKRVYNNSTVKKNFIKILELSYGVDSGSVIQECNIFEKTKSQFVKDFEVLYNRNAYKELEVARSIRTYIEGLLKRLSPEDFKEEKWLGDYIKIIRDEPKHYLYPLLQTISDINDYAKEFHHSTCSGEICTVVNKQELEGYTQQTLNLRKAIIDQVAA